jgi:ribosomal protein S18 acetylase RimI-like enzyme
MHRDVTAINALDRKVFEEKSYGPILIRQMIDLSGPLFLVAEQQGDIVGFCLCSVMYDRLTSFILSLAVAPEKRRQNLGHELLEHASRRSKSLGCESIKLTVDTYNHGAIKLYSSLGFHVIETFDGYHEAHNRKYLMARDLSSISQP